MFENFRLWVQCIEQPTKTAHFYIFSDWVFSDVNINGINEIMLRDSVVLAKRPAGGVVTAHSTIDNHTCNIFLLCEAEDAAHSYPDGYTPHRVL